LAKAAEAVDRAKELGKKLYAAESHLADKTALLE
jgi:hypothetical protein